jgi:hypothetical protein
MKQIKINLFSLILCLLIISNILAISSTIKAQIKTIEKNSSFLTTNLKNYLQKNPSNKKVKTIHTLIKTRNNVYQHTLKFYIGLIQNLSTDARTSKMIAFEIVQKCPKLNVFDAIRENLINCKSVERNLNPKNRKIIKDFRIGCTKQVLNTIYNQCSILKESNANKVFSLALNKLNNINRDTQERLRYIGNKFVRRTSYHLRVFKELIDQRFELLRQAELKRKKVEAEKRKKQEAERKKKALKNRKGKRKGMGKGKGKGKGKKKSFLEISNNLKKENFSLNSNLNKMERKKKSKGASKAKNLKLGNLGVILPKNNPYDILFLKETELNNEKVNLLVNFIVRYIFRINSI